MIELMNGIELPCNEAEEAFVYTYSAAQVGNNLYDIIIELSPQVNNDDPVVLSAILMAYALVDRERELVNQTLVDDGEIQ